MNKIRIAHTSLVEWSSQDWKVHGSSRNMTNWLSETFDILHAFIFLLIPGLGYIKCQDLLKSKNPAAQSNISIWWSWVNYQT